MPLRLALAAATLLASATAQSTPAEDAERAKLLQERATIDSQYASRIAECQQRFVVTSCVEDAKRDRRHGLDGLRSRQIALDEVRRKERSAARRSELSANAAEQAKREAAKAIRPAAAASEPSGRDEPTRTHEPQRPSAGRGSSAKRQAGVVDRASASKGAGGADRAAKESRSRATFEARQQHAAEHREEVADKAAKRLQGHRPATPLPIPKVVAPAP
jgi:colicin import membrane protein